LSITETKTNSRRRIGRPRIDPNAVGDVVPVRLRLTADALAQVEEAAAATGMTKAGWCRQAIAYALLSATLFNALEGDR
jgi:hypothetical protein